MEKMKEWKEIEKLLINVDMVNGFVKKGAMADSYIEHIVPVQINGTHAKRRRSNCHYKRYP